MRGIGGFFWGGRGLVFQRSGEGDLLFFSLPGEGWGRVGI